MNVKTFATVFHDVAHLNNSEGPSYNVFEPKFQARDQMTTLRDTVVKLNTESPSLKALQQITLCLCFNAVNMIDTEEDEEALGVLQVAYAIMMRCVTKELTPDISTVKKTPMEDIKKAIADGKHPLEDQDTHEGSVAYVTVMNALGYYFSLTSGPLAKDTLELAEKCYVDWNASFEKEETNPSLLDLTIDSDGRLVEGETDGEESTPARVRFEMENAYTSTLFFLAQVYGPLGQPMARPCHLTVYRQLLLKREYSPVVWADNVIQLSSYYCQMALFGKAFHCLLAGKHVMPVDDDAEKTTGKVALAFGTFYVSVLSYYGELYATEKGKTESEADSVELQWVGQYWVDFPGVPKAESFEPVTNFEQARAIFKEGLKWLHDAAAIYTFEDQCITHISILRYMSQLYAALGHFEADRNRGIAMIQRQIALVDKLPEQLNFNAYPTDYRQLLLDLGELYMNMLELRGQQRRFPTEGEVPLKDGAYNTLVDRTVNYFKEFCDTWCDPRTKVIPDVLNEDDRLPYFTALMRLAQAQLRYITKSPMAEYENYGVAIDRFKKVIDFAKANQMPEDKIKKELDVAEQLVSVLTAKREGAAQRAMT
ncbi:hypothetical protein AGDE_07414 [Angomonas deanei]|uniref:KIF-binding protein n=1 Tax=Angomonas deanei TaxID=59799 RepID=A0A7G2CEL8_9TRYP|nr:hypothetical protein AGDE_07414 [Angomonas deanei]CAD2217411.1 KIF-1 binding protein C terminal, putative [Angomonas deanei]|eukprot:EPY35370.1 hypothetical protein AGDE_07414 [Angomonas deanei]